MGAIALYRQEVRPFTDKQMELVASFAARPSSRSEHAAADGLREIAAAADRDRRRAAGHLQLAGRLAPVFEAMLESATRVGGSTSAPVLREGEVFRAVSMHGATPDYL